MSVNQIPVTYMPGGGPALHIGGPVGAVLVHGYTGAPQEMRWLGDSLAARGLTVLRIRLTGHGTVKEDMAAALWQHWAGDVLDAITLLRQNCARVYIAGLSMGGLLSLYAGIHYPVDGVVSLAAPVYLEDPRLRYLPLLRPFVRYLPKGDAQAHDSEDRRVRAIQRARGELETGRAVYRYEVIPSVAELTKLMRHVEANLPRLAAPLLLMHARDDQTAPPGCMPHIYSRVSSKDKTMLWIESGGHVVTEGVHMEKVFAAVWEFIRERSAGFFEFDEAIQSPAAGRARAIPG
ncbi:MAG: alpha/beta fold hydrolase [Anaerolineae bacterium]|nr:alpha/beta fold hydrolase [Anaerolineae bacterium]